MPEQPLDEPSHRYSLYLENDLNRVFTNSLAPLAATELRIVTDRALPQPVENLETKQMGRAQLLRFDSSAPVESVQRVIGGLSASGALFRHHSSPGTYGTDGTDAAQGAESDQPVLLEPLPLQEGLVFGTELATTQRYRGKTNERLTRAMLNCALAVAGVELGRDGEEPGNGAEAATVLDPMCGRGTTLGWALAYGLNAIGIEPDKTSLDQHAIFLQTWAKRSHLPHKAQRHRPGNAEGRWLDLHVAPNRAALKAGGYRVETFHSDGANQKLPIKKHSVDAIVTDLPYGVQHSGKGKANEARQDAKQPGTCELLTAMLPTWRRWLRPGGSLCLAWNVKQADRSAVSRTLAEAGFKPVVVAGGHTMRHVVDATIDRDVLVAERDRGHETGA